MRSHPLAVVLALASLVALSLAGATGCGGASGGGAGAPDTAAHDEGQGADGCTCGAAVCGTDPCGNPCGSCEGGAVCVAGACEAAASCDFTGFAAASGTATLKSGAVSPVLRYEAQALPSKDRLVLEALLGDGHDGPTGPGAYDLTGSNYADCGLCLLAYKGCSPLGCARTFLADAGTVHIDALPAAGGGDGQALKGRVEGARLREVYIDPKTFASVPLAGGDSWCVPELAFELTADEQVLTDACEPAGDGDRVGDRIGDFTLTNCLGDTRSLHALCGSKQAVWIAAVAGWCQVCSEKVPQIGAYYEGHKAHGLEVMIVLGEDQAGAKPTQQYCKAYADAHGVDPAIVWIDHGELTGGWQETFAKIDPYAQGAQGGTIGLPWEALLRGVDMRYLWSTNSGHGDLMTHLEPLLSK